MSIRKEYPKDYDTVCSIAKIAFEHAKYSDGNEEKLVRTLRKSAAFIPDLSLATVINNRWRDCRGLVLTHLSVLYNKQIIFKR